MDIKDKLTLHIKAIQTDRNNEKNTMEFFTEASFHEKDKTQYITYKESEVSGMEGTTTTIKISGDQMELIRFGTIASKMCFIKNKPTMTLYKTQYGNFDLRIYTEELTLDIKKTGSSLIHVQYNLDINGEPAYTQVLSIKFQL